MLKKKPNLTKIQELEKRSEDAIGVFKNTLDSLTKIDEEAQEEIQVKVGQITALHLEINRIEDRQASNNKFINKLKEFFE